MLIVEDNIINLKLLEAFMKKLKVRWQTAMNGRDAVTKWRAGGFHLVLMDIQLPVMNGLDATKEIRRLERLNNIGVFSNSASNTPTVSTEDDKGFIGCIENEEMEEEDSKSTGDDFLINTSLFKSPVIIVALTASSLQSDRHEALAAGCNDFLTKVRSHTLASIHLSKDNHWLTYQIQLSRSTSSGLSAKSWSGVACKHSSTLTAGENGKTSLNRLKHHPHLSRWQATTTTLLMIKSLVCPGLRKLAPALVVPIYRQFLQEEIKC